MKVKIIIPTVINGKVRYEKEEIELDKKQAMPLIKRGRVVPVRKDEVEKAVKPQAFKSEKTVKVKKK